MLVFFSNKTHINVRAYSTVNQSSSWSLNTRFVYKMPWFSMPCLCICPVWSWHKRKCAPKFSNLLGWYRKDTMLRHVSYPLPSPPPCRGSCLATSYLSIVNMFPKSRRTDRRALWPKTVQLDRVVRVQADIVLQADRHDPVHKISRVARVEL